MCRLDTENHTEQHLCSLMDSARKIDVHCFTASNRLTTVSCMAADDKNASRCRAFTPSAHIFHIWNHKARVLIPWAGNCCMQRYAFTWSYVRHSKHCTSIIVTFSNSCTDTSPSSSELVNSARENEKFQMNMKMNRRTIIYKETHCSQLNQGYKIRRETQRS